VGKRQRQKQPQILRLTTPRLEVTPGAPFAQDDRLFSVVSLGGWAQLHLRLASSLRDSEFIFGLPPTLNHPMDEDLSTHPSEPRPLAEDPLSPGTLSSAGLTKSPRRPPMARCCSRLTNVAPTARCCFLSHLWRASALVGFIQWPEGRWVLRGLTMQGVNGGFHTVPTGRGCLFGALTQGFTLGYSRFLPTGGNAAACGARGIILRPEEKCGLRMLCSGFGRSLSG